MLLFFMNSHMFHMKHMFASVGLTCRAGPDTGISLLHHTRCGIGFSHSCARSNGTHNTMSNKSRNALHRHLDRISTLHPFRKKVLDRLHI